MTWVHWVLYNIPAAATGLLQGVKPEALPSGTLERLERAMQGHVLAQHTLVGTYAKH
jgi:phosphatidylethanolamine-binding protein (PEBP) family uncharacterized protein